MSDPLIQDALKKVFGTDEDKADRLVDLLNEDDEIQYQHMKNLRDLASEKIDFSSFDHVNSYNKENFASGLLEALENTRKRLSITTAEKLIDFLYVFGYSGKRIVFILFSAGYVDFHRRTINAYINRHKYRLNKEREALINEMNARVESVFQNMQASVMQREKSTCETLLLNLDRLNQELAKLDVTDEEEGPKFMATMKKIEKINGILKGMHGIEQLREAEVFIRKTNQVAKSKRVLELGFLDEELKEAMNKERDVAPNGTASLPSSKSVLDL